MAVYFWGSIWQKGSEAQCDWVEFGDNLSFSSICDNSCKIAKQRHETRPGWCLECCLKTTVAILSLVVAGECIHNATGGSEYLAWTDFPHVERNLMRVAVAKGWVLSGVSYGFLHLCVSSDHTVFPGGVLASQGGMGWGEAESNGNGREQET